MLQLLNCNLSVTKERKSINQSGVLRFVPTYLYLLWLTCVGVCNLGPFYAKIGIFLMTSSRNYDVMDVRLFPVELMLIYNRI